MVYVCQKRITSWTLSGKKSRTEESKILKYTYLKELPPWPDGYYAQVIYVHRGPELDSNQKSEIFVILLRLSMCVHIYHPRYKLLLVRGYECIIKYFIIWLVF